MPPTSPHAPVSDLCYILSYDHGGLVLWGYEHFVHHLRELLGWLDRHPRLKMGLDNETWMYDWLAANQPAVLHELRQALSRYRGRLGIASCTYGQPLAAFLLEESNIRQIALGLETTRQQLGYELDIYSFSEHAAFAQLPQILAGLGIRGALMRTHYLMYGFCPGYDVPVAWWQGPDGSRVPCVPTYHHQERPVTGHRAHPPGPYGLTTEDTWILTRYPSAESPRSLDSFRERFAHIRPLVASRIDDSGLKREALVQELDGRGGGYQWATLEDVFDALSTPAATIAPTSEDFGVRMPWGYRGNELLDLARAGEIAVLTAERLLGRLTVDGQVPPADAPRHQAEIRQAWKDLLVGQHHDVQVVARAGTLGRERLLASLERSRAITASLFQSRASGACDDPADFIAFNPLPWRRQEPNAVLPDGTPLPGTVTAPALGFAPFRPDQDDPLTAAPIASLSFETEHYRVKINPAGGIESLTTREGKELLRTARRSGHLAGAIDGVAHEGSGTAKAMANSGGFRVEERGAIGPLPYTATWRFPRNGRRIDYTVSVRFNGERIGAPTEQRHDSRSCFVHEQKLRTCFYPAVEMDSALGVYDVPFGRATTRRGYVEGNYWTALADGDSGLAVFNRGTMGACRDDATGAFSVPLAFSTHCIWGDEVICGQRQWSLGLLPWRGANWQTMALHRRALAFAFPIVAVPGMLKQATEDYLPIDNPDVHLTALYVEGSHGYVRLFNGSDREQPVPLRGPFAVVDLRHRGKGRPRQPPTMLQPWEILTARLW